MGMITKELLVQVLWDQIRKLNVCHKDDVQKTSQQNYYHRNNRNWLSPMHLLVLLGYSPWILPASIKQAIFYIVLYRVKLDRLALKQGKYCSWGTDIHKQRNASHYWEDGQGVFTAPWLSSQAATSDTWQDIMFVASYTPAAIHMSATPGLQAREEAHPPTDLESTKHGRRK